MKNENEVIVRKMIIPIKSYCILQSQFSQDNHKMTYSVSPSTNVILDPNFKATGHVFSLNHTWNTQRAD